MRRLGMLLCLVVVVAVQIGCGRAYEYLNPAHVKPGHSRITFGDDRTKGVLAHDMLTGGAMVYAVNDDNDDVYSFPFVDKATANSSGPYSIPNGNYRFWALGWDGVNFGSNYCGAGRPTGDFPEVNVNHLFVLDGTSAQYDIHMDLSQADCNDTTFTESPWTTNDYVTGSIFKELRIHSCSALPGNYQFGCTAPVGKDIKAYKLELVHYHMNNGVYTEFPGSSMFSSCYAAPTNEEYATNITSVHWPIGNTGLGRDEPFYTKLHVYYDGPSDCTIGGGGMFTYHFRQGLLADTTAPTGTGHSIVFPYNNTTPGEPHLYINTTVIP